MDKNLARHVVAVACCWLAWAGDLYLAQAQQAPAEAREVDLAELARRDPAVAAVLDLPREMPAAQLRAILALADLGHPEAAGSLLAELANRDLSDAEQAALVEQFGTARLLRLLEATGPGGVIEQPASREFLKSALETAAAQARDPRRLAAAISQLGADARGRRAAQKTLAAAGDAGIRAAVAALAAGPTQPERSALLETLGAMQPAVDDALLALLAESRGPIRRDAAWLAGRLRLFEALPWLATMSVAGDPEAAAAAQQALVDFDLPQPSPGEAAELIRRELAEESARAERADRVLLPRRWWTWNEQQQQLDLMSLSPRQVHALRLERLADLLAENDAEASTEDRERRLLYAWEAAAALGQEPDVELVSRWQELSAAELSQLLDDALTENLFVAGQQAAKLIGERGDPSVLTSLDGKPRPLAEALKSPHDAQRFAALRAILQLHLETSFAGASGVVDCLWHFASGAGNATAVAAASTAGRANLWAGQLRGLGYDAVAATTGRGALARVLDPTRAARLALVLIENDISLPGVREVVFQIRRNPKTARTPLGILCSLSRLDEMEQLAEHEPALIAEPRPHGKEAMAELVKRLTSLPGAERASEEIRVERARFALQAIAELLASGGPYDEIVRDVELAERALYQPPLAAAAIDVFRHAGTSASQAALAGYVTAGSPPLESRQKAAAAFTASIEQFGVQLPPAELARQYNRYNASADADPQAQALLSGMLDAIEGK